jgi:hypothetical protein
MKRRRSLKQLKKLAHTFNESQKINNTSHDCKKSFNHIFKRNKKRLQRFALDIQRKGPYEYEWKK